MATFLSKRVAQGVSSRQCPRKKVATPRTSQQFVILSLEMGAIAAVGKQIVSTVLTFAIRAELQGHCELRYISSEA